jgi:zinc protease
VSEVRRSVLDNGLTVIAERRGLGRVVFTGIVYRVGSRDERPGLTGISHLLEHMMFKGTERYRKGEVAAIVERNGGQLNAFTSEDVTMYYEVFAADRWKLGLEIEAERMVNLAIDEGELEAEREVVLEERAMYLDIPSVEMSEELIAASFRESPYRWPIIGWESDIRAITHRDMLEHYRRYYAPGNATLVVVGDVEPDEVIAAAAERFGGISGAAPIERRIPREGELARATRILLERRTALPQLQVLFRAPEIRTHDSEAMHLLMQVLSGTRTGRLDLALLETGKAGDVHVQYHAKADPSTVLVAVEGQPGVSLDEVEDIVWREVERLAREDVAEDELERARNQVEAQHVFALQSPSNRGFVLGWHEAHGDVAYADEIVRRLHDLGPADLRTVATAWLQRGRSGTARLVPANGGRGGGAAAAGPVPGLTALRGGLPLHGVACPRRRFRSGVAGVPTVRRHTLGNGLSVMLQPDRTDPVVAVSMLLGAGSTLDPDGREGLALLTADTLERGPRGTDFVEFSRRFERIGSSLSVAAGSEVVHAGTTFLSRHTDRALALLQSALTDPGFREDDLEVVRRLALNDLEAREDDLDDVADDVFFRGVAGDHPYRKLPHGTRAGVEAVRAEDVRAFHAFAYRMDRSYLAVVGSFDEDAVLRRLQEGLGRLPRPDAAAEELPAFPEDAAERVLVTTRPEKGQAKIILGGPGLSATDPDRLAGVAANHVLGGSAIRSRLGDEIRDNRGLAYSVYSRNYHRRRGGVFAVHMGTRPENVRGAVEAIRGELERIAEGVTPAELDDARAYLTGSFPLRFTTYGKLARFWTRAAFYGWPDDHLQTYVPRVRALEAADLKRAAGRLVAGAKLLAVAGPVDGDLEPVADG